MTAPPAFSITEDEKKRERRSLAIYALGVPVLALATHQTLAWAVVHGLVPFLVGDVLKALAASALLPAAWSVTDRTR